MKIFFDTSTLVASLVNVHPAHTSATSWLRRIMAGSDSGFIALSMADYTAVIEQAAASGIIGGAVYDALIVQAAVKADARAISDRVYAIEPHPSTARRAHSERNVV